MTIGEVKVLSRSSSFNPQNFKSGSFTTFTTHLISSVSDRAKNDGLTHEPALFLAERHIDNVLRDVKTEDEALARFLFDRTLEALKEDSHLAEQKVIRIGCDGQSWKIFIDPYKRSWVEGVPIRTATVKGERKDYYRKTGDINRSLEARAVVRKKECDEAVLVDEQGYLREGAWSNIFVVKHDGQIVTPSLRIFKGVTRGAVQSLVTVKEEEVSLFELEAEGAEMFITQATTGITPVSALDGIRFLKHDVTKDVMSRYQKCIQEHGIPILGAK